MVAVKGKSQSVKVYELIDSLANATPLQLEKADIFTKGFDAFISGNLHSGKAFFEEYLQHAPNDRPAMKHSLQCEKLIKEGLPTGWKYEVCLEEK